MSNLRSELMDTTDAICAGLPVEDTAIEALCQAWRDDDALRRQVLISPSFEMFQQLTTDIDYGLVP